MDEITVDDIKKFSIFDDTYLYNVKYLGFSYEFKNTHFVDCINKYKIYLESHGKIYYILFSYGVPWNDYELLKLELHEIKKPIHYTKTGNKIPEGVKHRYYINDNCDIVNAYFFSELFTEMPYNDYCETNIHDYFEGKSENFCSRNELVNFVNSKKAR